jgi:hypothetical protein
VNRPRKRSDGRVYVRLPERWRWPANAAHHRADVPKQEEAASAS